jgi:hypothetical protein
LNHKRHPELRCTARTRSRGDERAVDSSGRRTACKSPNRSGSPAPPCMACIRPCRAPTGALRAGRGRNDLGRRRADGSLVQKAEGSVWCALCVLPVTAAYVLRTWLARGRHLRPGGRRECSFWTGETNNFTRATDAWVVPTRRCSAGATASESCKQTKTSSQRSLRLLALTTNAGRVARAARKGEVSAHGRSTALAARLARRGSVAACCARLEDRGAQRAPEAQRAILASFLGVKGIRRRVGARSARDRRRAASWALHLGRE